MGHGAVSQSIPIVTAYDNLGEEGVKHSLVRTRAKAVYCDPHLLPTLVNPLKAAKEIGHVIYNSDGEVKQENIDKLKAEHGYLNILSFEELRQLGQNNPVEPLPPQPEDLCCIMYTSGSTGTPKGVPIKHKAVVAASELLLLLGLVLDMISSSMHSCWCHDNHWPISGSRGCAFDLPPSCTYPRVCFRECMSVLGRNHGLW